MSGKLELSLQHYRIGLQAQQHHNSAPVPSKNGAIPDSIRLKITADFIFEGTMSHSALGIAETIQSASIKRHPSPRHDINPSTAASEKVPYEEADPSDAASITSDILDQPVLRPVARRRDLPPLPDLRFEQSYLASLRGADTWQRVAWITVRDQVGFPHIHTLCCLQDLTAFSRCRSFYP